MFDNFSGMFEVHTGNKWKKLAQDWQLSFAAGVLKRGHTVQKLFVSCMRKRRRGWIDLFAAVVYWRLCVLGFEKTPYSQWDASAWRPVVSFDSVWSGDEDGIYGRMGRAAAGIWGGAYDGDWRDLWIFDSYREFTDCPVPSVSVSHDRCGGHQNGSRPVWCRRATAGRADFPVRAGSCRNMVARITYPAWDCQAAAYISCVLFVPVRAWGKRRAVLSGSAGWKRGIFLSGTVPVFGSDWGGADSVSVRKMACD